MDHREASAFQNGSSRIQDAKYSQLENSIVYKDDIK